MGNKEIIGRFFLDFEIACFFSRFGFHGSVEFLLYHPVVWADGDGGEIDVPDGIVGLLDGGHSRALPPLVVEGLHQPHGEHEAKDNDGQPTQSERIR